MIKIKQIVIVFQQKENDFFHTGTITIKTYMKTIEQRNIITIASINNIIMEVRVKDLDIFHKCLQAS